MPVPHDWQDRRSPRRENRMLIGHRLGHYEVLAKLGEGGMGEVFRATDTRLGRPVALKVLPAGMSDDRERLARFQREARAVAALNHPNIVTLYSVEEADGLHFLTMELIEGQSLAERIPERGLPIDQVVTAGAAIADALTAAHDRGIVHRDLKPANVMLTRDGRVKVLDFGLAKEVGSADRDDETIAAAGKTQIGVVMGTPAYMSPEQLAGRPLDHRTDIFSFGILLYEMCSGRRPFTGTTSMELASAILRDPPPALERTDLPPDLARLIRRCLDKDPQRRVQTARDVGNELREIARPAAAETRRTERGTSAATALPSIVVLPFANLSADRENEYFGDGLAEDIINALAQFEGLKVIARTSAFSFKGKNEDVRQIAQALGVTHVLEGSVRRAGDRIRVTTQLIAAADGAQLWSERYDRPMADVFAVQDEIRDAIATALKGRLSGTQANPRHYTPVLSAYETFLRGRAHLTQFTPDAWNRAKGLFEQAIALDAKYADPHAELALGYFICGMHGIRPMREVAPLVRAEVERALALNPSDSRPRFLSGAIALVHDYDWKAAETHFAASMNATDVSGHARWIYASLYLRGLGRFEESANEMGRAVQHDPLNATWHAIWGAHLIDATRFDQAIEEGLRATELEPNYFIAQHLLGETYWASGKWHEAMAAFERAYRLAPWNAVAVAWLAVAHWHRGELARAEQLIAETGDSPLPPWGRVVYHLLTADLEAAADWYQRMIEDRDPFALVYAESEMVAPLRGHHRWPALAALMQLPAASSAP